jgi:tetratricopeptide (TPR) repeat protein
MHRRAIHFAAVLGIITTLAAPPAGAQQHPAAPPAAPREKQFSRELANLHALWKARKYREAIRPAERLTNLAREIYGENHLRFSGSLFNLAMLYRNTRQYETAFAVFAKVFTIQHALRSPSDKAYKRVLTQVDQSSQRLGTGREVVGYYEMALEKLAAEGAAGTTHEAEIKASLGRLLRFLADFDRAEKVLREALAIRRRIAAPDDISIVSDLNNLAGLVRARQVRRSRRPL